MAATMRPSTRPHFESPSPGLPIRTSRRQHLVPTSADGPPARAKSGCWTCRLRRKKCDERQSNGTCETCARLKIDCLGWGAKRPDWLRHKEQVEAYKNQIKNQLQLTNIHKAATARNGSPKGTSASRDNVTRPTTAATSSALDAALIFPAEDPLSTDSDGAGQDADYPEQNTIYEHLISPGVLSGTTSEYIDLTTNASYVYDNVSSFAAAYGPVEAQAAAQPYQFGTDAAASSALAIPAPTGTVDVAASMPWTFGGQSFGYEPRVRHFPPIPDRGQTSAHVFYYFSRVRAMQYCFGGNSVTDVMHDILVREPYGVVSNAICALASAHNNLLRRSRGLEADDLSSDMSPARQFYTRAFTQMDNSRQRNNGKFTEVDATAALHFVSYWLFNGGSGDWQTALNIAGDWLEGSGVMRNGDPALAIQNLSNTGRFAAKTVIWFDIFSAITTLAPPRFLPMYKRLFRGGGGVGFWAAGLQMENVMGADDATILAMAEIAELAAWKEEHRKAGCLSTMELSRRAAAIERDLRITSPATPWIQTLDETTMAQLNAFNLQSASTSTASASSSAMSTDFASAAPAAASALSFDLPAGVQNPYVVPAPVDPTVAEGATGEELPLPVNDIELRRRATNVFREGAVLYLHTVISGCNPNVPEVAAAVKATKETLEALSASDIDRSLVFPICLAGCMANDRTTHNFFRNRLAGYQGVGNCSQAVQLMDAVWSKRERERTETCWRETMQELGLNLLLV